MINDLSGMDLAILKRRLQSVDFVVVLVLVLRPL
jgi:hypothetical protein